MLAGARDRPAGARKVVEFTGLGGFSYETINEGLLGLAVHEPQEYPSAGSGGEEETLICGLGDGDLVPAEVPRVTTANTVGQAML